MKEGNKTKKQKLSGYKGYIVKDNDHISVIKKNIDAKTFFESYIKLRKPVKLDKNLNNFLDLSKFSANKIAEYLDYKSKLQVEKKYKHGFGSGMKRLKLTLNELMSNFENGDHTYYLTTQYDDTCEAEKDNEKTSSENDKNVQKINEENGDEDEDEDESQEEEDNELTPFGTTEPNINFVSDNFSDTSSIGSIDLDNLKDDYEDDFNDDFDEDEDSIESDALYRLKSLFQPPLTNKYKEIPTNPPLFPNLITQQINLWMGCAGKTTENVKVSDPSEIGRYIPGNGSSSGLHHDHADNLYILVSGKKRFTLYSPSDVEKLYTIGSINKVYQNGIIDYKSDNHSPSWKSIRDDGALISEIARWKLQDPSISKKTKDQLQKIIQNNEISHPLNENESLDPPSFSKVPPALCHIDEFPDEKTRDKLIDFANQHFPGFLDLNKLTVWLEPGEMLYLPTGWFHEVSSFGAENPNTELENVHIALNYWFIPPNNDLFEQSYADNYWKEDWEFTKESIELYANEKLKLDL